MTNLFSFATKELSQDAFLMWVLSNWDCKETGLRKVSRAFIAFLTDDNSKNEVIQEIKLSPQWSKIDICAEIKTDKNNYALFIEDKVSSEEHNQLLTYNEKINSKYNQSNYKILKRFYKTDLIEASEEIRVNNAGWKIIDIASIHSFWENHSASRNIIVSQYACHINDLWDSLNYEKVPTGQNKEDLIKWKGFFTYLGKQLKKCSFSLFNYQNKYMCLKIKPFGKTDEKMPYLEVRSRDTNNGKIRFLILLYDADFSKNPSGIDKLKQEISNHENNGIFVHDNRKKQVAHTQRANWDETPSSIQKIVDEYIDIINFWQY